MMKKGIALMITVSMIAVITAIVFTTVTLLDRSMTQTQALLRMTQSQQILSSFVTSLKKLTAQVDTPEALEMILGEFPSLSDPQGIFSMSFSIRPLQGKLNLNSLIGPDETTLSQSMYELLFMIFNHYRLISPDQLIALIADSIDKDAEERSARTEQRLYRSDISNGMLSSLEEVKALANIYDTLVRDPMVKTIPWEELFYLHDEHNATIDCNFMSPFLANLVGLQYEMASELSPVRCDLLDGDQNETLTRYNIAPFTKGKPYVVEVEVYYEIEGQSGGFYAHYDFSTQRISHIKAITRF